MCNFIFCSLGISRDTGYIGVMVTWKNSCLYQCESFAGDLPSCRLTWILDGDQAAGLDGLKMPEILAIHGLPIGGQLEKSIGLLYKKTREVGHDVV